ncbi:MAG TPA: hypothetical protein VEA80_04770 [Vitreimonas sp.]|uniref:hypothetical protein n=1 Tax=Vitreimonas sp. TaxID=3069702 RepID=UPI002D675C42|nr:hypothetical protein [Vitreimonas sp.]HYD86764.1 hypothetical protein [Vitreimonas sp.]
MSSVASSGLVRFTRDLYLATIPQLAATGTQLGGWVVVGNGLALLAAFNAILAGTQCDAGDLMQALRYFGGGLAAGFVGAVVAFLTSMHISGLLGQTANLLSLAEMNEINLVSLEARMGPQPEGNVLQTGIDDAMRKAGELQSKLAGARPYALAAYGFYTLSVALFALGAAAPALSVEALQLCAGSAS